MTKARIIRRYLICAACVSVSVWLFFSIARVNATTVALSMLLLVLGAATYFGLSEAIFTSLLCVLAFNYFVLPPIGTLTIADPQNWVALLAFLISAVVASQLSTRAKARAEEAAARRSEIERLYRLSRAMLMQEAADIVETALVPAIEIFGLRDIAFFDVESGQLFGSREDPALGKVSLARVATSKEPSVGEDFAIVPVLLGSRTLGALGFAGKALTAPERDSIASLVAISYERLRALDRATAAEAARRGEKLKTFLLDGIAHDLKTPLTAIKTCVTTLIMFPPQAAEKREELLCIIDEETDRLQRTITEAIQLARIESGKVALDRDPVNVHDVVERAFSGSRDRERFSIAVPREMTINGDALLLEQAIRQVVENAGKYAAGDTAIEIAAHQDGESLGIQVLDRGPGISQNELGQIFEKFYRGTRGRNSVSGTGMGLAIAKGIIEVHGGSIWAENRPGGGAVISCRFPLA